MSRERPVNLPASIRQRLLNRARRQGVLFDDMLRLYAAERFLYRIAVSEYRGLFILKGVRGSFSACLGTARARVQIDLGFNDAVYPRPVDIVFPSLLDQPESRLLGYPPETSIAEKTHAMVELAEFNSRMKDFHDLYWFQKHQTFDLSLLADAMRNTFQQRETPVPTTLPSILVPTTQSPSAHQTQWNAYLREKRFSDIPKSFQEICRHITTFLEIPLRFAATDNPGCELHWTPEKGWSHFDNISS